MPPLGEQPVFVTLDTGLYINFQSDLQLKWKYNTTMTTNNYILCVNVGVN